MFVLLTAVLLGLCAIGLLMLWHRLIAMVLRLLLIGHLQGDANKPVDLDASRPPS